MLAQHDTRDILIHTSNAVRSKCGNLPVLCASGACIGIQCCGVCHPKGPYGDYMPAALVIWGHDIPPAMHSQKNLEHMFV
jgi:hypothetical protein